MSDTSFAVSVDTLGFSATAATPTCTIDGAQHLYAAPSRDVCERARLADARLRASLARLQSAQTTQALVARTTTPIVTATAPAPTTAVPALSPRLLLPQPITLEWPLAPLAQRAKVKMAHDAMRERRRSAAIAKAKAKAAAAKDSGTAMSATEMMRSTLSQPLGVMAARLLSAATGNGAPVLFCESPAYASDGLGGTSVLGTSSSSPRHTLSNKVFKDAPSTTAVSTKQAAIASLAPPTLPQQQPQQQPQTSRAASNANVPKFQPRLPLPAERRSKRASSLSQQLSASQKQRHHRSRGMHHNHLRCSRHQGHRDNHHSRKHRYSGPTPSNNRTSLFGTSTAAPSSPCARSASQDEGRRRNHTRQASDPYGVPLTSSPVGRNHHRHRHHHSRTRSSAPAASSASKPVAVSPTAAKKDSQLLSASWKLSKTTAPASSPTSDFFGHSPLKLLAQTFGTVASKGSPTGGEAEKHHKRHRRRGASKHRSLTFLKRCPSSSLSSSSSCVSYATSGCSSSCSACARSCRRGRYDGTYWTSSSSSSSSFTASTSSSSGYGTSGASCGSTCSCESFVPMTAPGKSGRYSPHAPLPLLLRCYGDAATRELFRRCPSTSTERTESRSSTPFSSEWSADTEECTHEGPGAASSPVPGGVGDGVFKEKNASTFRNTCREGNTEKAARLSEAQAASHTTHSGSTPTQLSFDNEMDAIERGQAPPYVSYLFAPEARVTDLRQLEGRLRRRDTNSCAALSSLSATCIEFCQVGNAYLVGTSSGVLWRIPVGGAEAVRATPLGSLWPPAAPAPVSIPGIRDDDDLSAKVGSGASAVPGSNGSSKTNAGASTVDVSSPTPDEPVPLSGHTAAVLSIAFNDDGSLYATTGMDGCVIVWKASTSAKLRRISAVWASAASSSSPSARRAPHLVRFMPQNNNFLLVSYLESSELHLYNSSTGLPVTNVAGTGLTRIPTSAFATSDIHDRSARSSYRSAATSHHNGAGGPGSGARRNSGGFSDVITALAVDLVAFPFFLAGDAGGTVALWTYRAGDLMPWPTLRATTAGTTHASGSSRHRHHRGGRHGSNRSRGTDSIEHASNERTRDAALLPRAAMCAMPLYQLPELRRVAAVSLPPQAGGVAAIGVSTLYAPQLLRLFRSCGGMADEQKKDEELTGKGDGQQHGGEHASRGEARPRSVHPLEATAQVLHTIAVQNRACHAAMEAPQASEQSVKGNSGGGGDRSRRGAYDKRSSLQESTNDTRNSSNSSSAFPHILADLPSRLSDTLSAFWGGVSGASTPSPATAPRRTPATTANASTNVTAATSKPPHTEKELLRQLRADALDVVCPLLFLVTAPCDTIYTYGLLLQLQRSNNNSISGGSGGGTSHNRSGPLAGKGGSGDRASSNSSISGTNVTTHGRNAAQPSVMYRLYPLLRTTGPSRMRHVGVGAVQSPDNPRLIVVAAPCEEGFVRVLPLLRLDAASNNAAAGLAANAAAEPPGATPTLSTISEAVHVNKSHVLATLPMPYGGRCTGLAWSPSGRFLVAVTAEGVVYQWSRVYLLSSAAAAASGHATGVHTTTPSPPARSSATLRRIASVGERVHGENEATDLTAYDPEGMKDSSTVISSAAGATSTTETKASAAAAVAAVQRTKPRHRGCDTEYSDTVHHGPPTLTFNGLLNTSTAGPSATAAAATAATLATAASAGVPPVASMVGESEAARIAFNEEDAWRESFQRELERQRREQAAMKLITATTSNDAENEGTSSGYWLDDATNSAAVSRDTLDDELGGNDNTESLL